MSSRSNMSVKEAVARGITRRYRNERVFRALGLMALLVGLGFLAFFFYTLIGNSYTALGQTRIKLDIELSPAVIDPEATRDPETLRGAEYLFRAARTHQSLGNAAEHTRLESRAEDLHPGAREQLALDSRGRDAVHEAPDTTPIHDTLHATSDDAAPSTNGASSVEGLDSRPSFQPPAAGAVQEHLDAPFGGAETTVPTQAVPGDGEETDASGSSTEDVPEAVTKHLDAARDLLNDSDRDAAATELFDADESTEQDLVAMTVLSWSRLENMPVSNIVVPEAMPAFERTAQDCIESVAEFEKISSDESPLQHMQFLKVDLKLALSWRLFL